MFYHKEYLFIVKRFGKFRKDNKNDSLMTITILMCIIPVQNTYLFTHTLINKIGAILL